MCDLAHQPPFRAALARTAPEEYRLLLTNHHIVLDGWSKPILLQEIFASYFGARLPAPVPYRRFITWLDSQDNEAAEAAWRKVFTGFETPRWSGRPDGWPWASGGGVVPGLRRDHRGPDRAGRSCHTTVSTVLQGAWAQILMWLTGQHDVAFGTASPAGPPMWPAPMRWSAC